MRIVKLQAENIKRLKAVEIVPEGNVVKLTGRNEQGKTSVLDAIWWALGGTKAIQEEPIRHGETKAAVTLDLGDLVVTRTFTPGNSYLKVENKDGSTFKSPQAVLDKLVGQFAFDPLEFARSDKQKQVETLLSVVDIQVDSERLREIARCDFAEVENPLVTLNNAYKAVYDSRTFVNRQLDSAKKVLQSMPEVEEAQPVSVAELVAEKDRLEAENRRNERERQAVKVKEAEVERAWEDIRALEAEIAKLQKQLAVKRLTLDGLEQEKGAMYSQLATLKDHDLSEINARIASADETNRRAEAWRERQKVASQVEALQQEADDYTRRLEAIRDYKNELVATAKFPVEGLDFGGGGVLYQGVPFEQASSAQKLQVSLAIAMALNPKLRVIRIDNGSLLDSEHLAVIERMAAENDFQIWLEVVDESGKVGIYIEDGEVRTDAGQTGGEASGS